MTYTKAPITIGYSPEYLKWTSNVTSVSRSPLALAHIEAQAQAEGIPIKYCTPVISGSHLDPMDSERRFLKAAHSPEYVDAVLDGTLTGDEVPSDFDKSQGRAAAYKFAGTRVLLNAMSDDQYTPQVYFNPEGTKHHAQRDSMNGFCVFNDAAYVIRTLTLMGKKVAYLDWDAHHGDGVENLTRNNPDALTISIHQQGIYPYRNTPSYPELGVINYSIARGGGDQQLLQAVGESTDIINEFDPDVLILAAGADGLAGDPLAQLKYTINGISQAATEVGKLAADLEIPVLIGGAGGYTPFSLTPVAWHVTVMNIYKELDKAARSLDLSTFDWGM